MVERIQNIAAAAEQGEVERSGQERLSTSVDAIAVRLFGDSFDSASEEVKVYLRDQAAEKAAWLLDLAEKQHGETSFASTTYLATIKQSPYVGIRVEEVVQDLFTAGVEPSLKYVPHV